MLLVALSGASGWQTQLLAPTCSCNRDAKLSISAREWLGVPVHSAIDAASDMLGTHAALTSSIAQLTHICGALASRGHLIGGASASHFGVRVVGKPNYSPPHVDAIGTPSCPHLLASSWAF